MGTALEEIAKEDPLLARVNGEEIRWTDIVESARGLPEQYRSQIEVIFPALLERLIDVRLIAWAGRQAGLAEDEAVRRQVAEFEDRLISEIFIRREVADRITRAMVRARYDAYAAGVAARAEVRARHILLDSEEDAKAAIAALDAGADFAELAQERSLGPTADRGGDLDYFTRNNMTPAFAEAAFALEAGEYSRTPVKTAFGWHVIKVEDRRAEEPAGFFEMRARLQEEMAREMMDEFLRALRERAEIELYPEAERAQ
ncbi:MAG: peptidylprolyl isomerase [Proteobacteria bacterium]|nr:peptidylprolyl isomerase [Pseudomonadota bacterium]